MAAKKFHRTGNPLNMATLPTVPKALGAVHIKTKDAASLTLADRRLFNTLLAHAYEEILDDKDHIIQLSKIRALSPDDHESNDRIKDSARRLNAVQVEFDVLRSDGRKGWGCTSLITELFLEDGDGLLRYRFASRLRPLLVDPAIHSRVQLAVTYQFTSKYSLILYEMLQRHADRSSAKWEWRVEIAELRDLLCVGDKMPDFKDLRRRAIEPALEEINKYANFEVDVIEDRLPGARGRIKAVVFTIRKKAKEVAVAVAKTETVIVRTNTQKATGFLTSELFDSRNKWATEAARRGAKLPPASTAAENIHKWVAIVADDICRENHL